MDEGCDGAKGVEMGLGRKVSHHYELVKELLGVDQGVNVAPQIVPGSPGGPRATKKGREGISSRGKKKEGPISGKRIKTDTPKPAKKSRKLPTTPRSRVRAALRQLYLRSRERAARLKLAGNCCERCKVKASKAKGREVGVQVHHKKGIAQWEKIIDLIFEQLLVDPSLLEVVCVDCHKAEHGKGEKG